MIKKKIAITGTSGLAGSIIQRLSKHNTDNSHNLFSFDVTPIRIEQEVDKSIFDVFINHAHKDFHQTNLLFEWFECWRNESDKYIINISSRAQYPNISKGYLYSAQKASLNQLSHNLIFNSDKKCKISTLNLGLFDSKFPSLSSSEIVDQILYLLLLPNHIEISEMTIQHLYNYCEVQKMKANNIL